MDANLLTFLLALQARMLGMHIVVEHNSWCSTGREGRVSCDRIVARGRQAQVRAGRWPNASRCVPEGIARKLVSNGVPSERTFVTGKGSDITKLFLLYKTQTLPLFPQDRGARLTTAGNGPRRSALEQLACDFGLADRVLGSDHGPYETANGIVSFFDVALAPLAPWWGYSLSGRPSRAASPLRPR